MVSTGEEEGINVQTTLEIEVLRLYQCCCVGYAVNIMRSGLPFLTNVSVRISCVRTSDRNAMLYYRYMYMYYSVRYGHTHAVQAEATATVAGHTGGIAACI